MLILALLVALIGSWLADPETWVFRALVVLVAASPGALAISVPMTVVSAIDAASKFGVIIISGEAFERFGTIGHVAVDKTGTLTRNRPTLSAVKSIEGLESGRVLAWAAALEQRSTHPLIRAIIQASASIPVAHDVVEVPGHGVRGTVEGLDIAVGNPQVFDAGILGIGSFRLPSTAARITGCRLAVLFD